MDFGRCQLPCSRLIPSEDQHSKCIRCVGLAHARDAIFDISNCKYCKNFTLKTLCARLAFFDRDSAVLPRRAAPEASFVREVPRVRRRSSRTWRVSSFHFLSLHRLGVTAQILWSSFLAPSPGARDAVSFGLEDILYSAASDSEDFGAASLDVLPPSGPHGGFFGSLLMCVLERGELPPTRWIVTDR